MGTVLPLRRVRRSSSAGTVSGFHQAVVAKRITDPLYVRRSKRLERLREPLRRYLQPSVGKHAPLGLIKRRGDDDNLDSSSISGPSGGLVQQIASAGRPQIRCFDSKVVDQTGRSTRIVNGRRGNHVGYQEALDPAFELADESDSSLVRHKAREKLPVLLGRIRRRTPEQWRVFPVRLPSQGREFDESSDIFDSRVSNLGAHVGTLR